MINNSDEGGNEPPNAPTNADPSNNSIDIPVDTSLSWQCSDPDNDPVTYDIYFGVTAPPPQVKSNHTEKTFTPSGDLDFSTT
ncbi:MAG: hypothetical protein ACOC80_04085 [Petrotogales bacterium]